jgi:hypothetical protein
MKAIVTLTVLLTVSTLSLVGCGDDGSTQITITRPAITQVSPGDGDTDVGLCPVIVVRFSVAMNVASLDSIRVKGVASGRVEYDDTLYQASLYLAELLDAETEYELRIHSAVMSQKGANIEGDSLVSFTTGPLDCEHAQDYLEPNNSLGTATIIETEKIYTALTNCLGDEGRDHYRFSLEEAAKVTIRSIPHAGMPTVTWHTTLYGPDGDHIHSLFDSLGSGSEVAWHYSYAAGENAVQVYRGLDGPEVVAYDLVLETSAPCQDDRYEENDFNHQAVLVTEGLIEGLRGCFKDRDYFDIELEAGETLTLTVTQVTSVEAWGGIYLWGPPGRVDEDRALGGPLQVSYTVDQDWTCRWNVTWDGDGIEYTLNIDVAP